MTETLFGSLKVERLHNHRRLHSTLGYTSPMAFEQKWLARQISLAA